ncbi:MAG TPA: glycosyltransferase family 1 protein [Bryobacteraceae bacterium]|nr:glycosyltransferase family 1 protein [Bryobacteraceae bacterium]
MSLRIVIDVRHIRDFGIGTYIRNLVRALGRIDRETQYLLVACREDVPHIPVLGPNFEIVLYQGRTTPPVFDIGYPAFLSRLRPDLCHMPLNEIPLCMPRPYIVTVHDMSSLLFKTRNDLHDMVRHYRLRRGLLRASHIIAVSGATRRDVEHILAVPSARVRLIYNAPDPAFLDGAHQQDPAEAARILERYQISYPFLLYAGTIRPQKNIPRLVEAFAVLRGELENYPAYRDIRLIIIGDEISRFPAVRHAVIQSRIEHQVRFLGFVPIETLRVFYRAASAFVFPSLYEGFGLPPLEAMACGTPVVTSPVSSLPEVVGEAAVIVNPENVFDIARGMREVLLDEDLRRNLIRRGFEQLARFSWEQTAEQVLAIYREATGASR